MPLNPHVGKSAGARQGGQDNRRSAPRFVLQLPISATILIPETSSDPVLLEGHTTVFSSSGMDIRLDDFTHAHYLQLLTEQRFIQITFMSFLDDKEVHVTGKVLGIDYHKHKASGETGPCDLRIYFEDAKSIELSRYLSFVNSLTSAG